MCSMPFMRYDVASSNMLKIVGDNRDSIVTYGLPAIFRSFTFGLTVALSGQASSRLLFGSHMYMS